jgi:hypothetical protein
MIFSTLWFEIKACFLIVTGISSSTNRIGVAAYKMTPSNTLPGYTYDIVHIVLTCLSR